jgi:putative transposase
VTFRFIEAHKDQWPVRVLCETLEVSPSGFYSWLKRPPSLQEQRREALAGRIKEIHAQARGCYGSPRVHAALEGADGARSVNTVAKIMHDNGIRAKTARRFRCRTTDSAHSLPVAGNILGRQFDPSGPNQAWVADITYVPTGEGWLYLAVVEDLFSRMIVGWSMADHVESRLVVDALDMAVKRRLPSEGLLAHSDRGGQYASGHYQRLLARHGITCSMSEVAQCWDNAPAESFFATLKKELVHHEQYATRAEARASIFEYVEVFYNNERLHSSLGYVTPAAYEQSR